MADKNEGGAMQVDVKLVRDLAEMLDVTNLSEIEVQDGERRIRVARTISAAPTTFMPAQTLAAQPGLEIGRATSELQSLMRISYAVFCLKKKKTNIIQSLPAE